MTAGERRLDRRDLDADPFTAEQCDTLFAAILIDDDVDDVTRLPPFIRLDYSPDELSACYRLCRQLWYSGFDPAALRTLAARLIRDRDLDAGDRVVFKHIRAKFKHFRYAQALYGSAHRHSRLLNRITVTMGHVQDGYRHQRRTLVLREALILRALLTHVAVAALCRDADRITLTSPASFRALLERDAGALRATVAHATVTGPQFHVARKIIGRQVSFWNTLLTLAPSPARYDMTRSLSAINGLMGSLHDDLVERRATDRADYGRSFVLADDIAARIRALTGVLGSTPVR